MQTQTVTIRSNGDWHEKSFGRLTITRPLPDPKTGRVARLTYVNELDGEIRVSLEIPEELERFGVFTADAIDAARNAWAAYQSIAAGKGYGRAYPGYWANAVK